MIIINTKIYLVIRKRYHNPIMQYTSGPNLKYSWQAQHRQHQEQENHVKPQKEDQEEKLKQQKSSQKSSKFRSSFGSIFSVATEFIFNKKESLERVENCNNVAVNSSSQNFKTEEKSKEPLIFKLSKRMPKILCRNNRNPSTQNLCYYKHQLISTERYMNYKNNANLSPIYTPIKKSSFTKDFEFNKPCNDDSDDIQINLIDTNLKKTSLTGKIIDIQDLDSLKQFEDEVILNETLKIDEFYNNLLNESPARLETLNKLKISSEINNKETATDKIILASNSSHEITTTSKIFLLT